MPLRTWQVPLADQAVEALDKHRLFINASTTGSGKTYVGCESIIRRRTPTLVIAPKAALIQWDRVAQEMGAKKFILDIINPAQISKTTGCKWYTRENMWQIPEGTTLLFDEVHRGASGIDSYTTKAVAQLKAYPGTALHAMSATVACDPLHLRALGFWAGMHKFNKPSFYSWCRENGCRDVDFADGTKRFLFTNSKRLATAVMTEIRAQFGDRFLAVGPGDIPGFPEQVLKTVLVQLSKRDTKEVEQAYAEMSERMKSRIGGGAMQTEMQKMAEGGRELERVEFIMARPLAEMAVKSVEDGNSTVQFFNFREPMARYVSLIKEAIDTPVSQIHGDQKPQERQYDQDMFQANKHYCMAAQTGAGGAALSLHDVHHERMRESFIIPGNDATAIRQAFGRIRRVGGTTAVQNMVFAAGTRQERVKHNMDRKFASIDALNGLTDADLLPEGYLDVKE